jgi:hypothetical protein
VPVGRYAAHRPVDHHAGSPGAYARGPMPVRWPAGYDRRMSSDPSPPSGSRTLLAWFGAAAFPVLLFLVLAAGPLNPALRFVMIVLVMLLPVGATRCWCWA